MRNLYSREIHTFSKLKFFFIAFSFALFIYMLWPGPSKIADFKALPDSDKSKLAGDNIEQVSNVAGYFSDNYRAFVVPFYSKVYQNLNHLPFPPLRLNHPPEFSWQVIKKHTDSTYIEELVYPLKSSIYVNGFEPFYPDSNPKFWGSMKFSQDEHSWFTKTTVRFFPSNVVARLIVWVMITFSIYWLYKIGRKIII